MNAAIIISSFLSGLLGAMGFGGGSVLIIYLTTFLSLEQKEAQGINLLFFVLTGFASVLINTKNRLTDKRALFSLLPAAIIGMTAGFMLLPVIEAELLRKLFGGMLVLLGFKELFTKKDSKKEAL
ncbi:MAG: sulfite exporter TauE/SafE family protein [Clostridia bacterium]|nr:sulfite exporter TauE/SafE family protein [Clostridia bacterium]